MRSSTHRLLRGFVALAFSCAALAAEATTLLAPQPAQAVTSADEVIQACGDQNFCAYGGSSVSNASSLPSMLPEGVHVVVIPQPNQAESIPTQMLADSLLQSTDANTVIVIEDHPGRDRPFVASTGGDAAQISESLHAANESDGGQAVAMIVPTLETSTPVGGNADSGPGDGITAVIGALVVSVIVIAGAVTLVFRRRGKRGKTARAVEGNRRIANELAAALDGEDGEAVGSAINELRQRGVEYPELRTQLDSLATHVSELIIRARTRGTDQQARLLQNKYRDVLSKLLKALAPDYYGDITKNPSFWNGAQERLEEVRRAVASVDTQALENIKQVNESRDLEFQVALDSLTRNVDEAQLSDVYTDRSPDHNS